MATEAVLLQQDQEAAALHWGWAIVTAVVIVWVLVAGWKFWRTTPPPAAERAPMVCLDRSCLATAQLAGATLANASLRGLDLSGAQLSGANLSGVDLRGANLAGAVLIGTDLSGACLVGADFTGAVIRAVDLTDARYDTDTFARASFDSRNQPQVEGTGADSTYARQTSQVPQ